MSSISTHICAASSIVVRPVKFQLADHSDRPYWFAVQVLDVTTHDGQQCSITFHLEEGCNALTAGEPVAMPPAPASEGEPA